MYWPSHSKGAPILSLFPHIYILSHCSLCFLKHLRLLFYLLLILVLMMSLLHVSLVSVRVVFLMVSKVTSSSASSETSSLVIPFLVVCYLLKLWILIFFLFFWFSWRSWFANLNIILKFLLHFWNVFVSVCISISLIFHDLVEPSKVVLLLHRFLLLLFTHLLLFYSLLSRSMLSCEAMFLLLLLLFLANRSPYCCLRGRFLLYRLSPIQSWESSFVHNLPWLSIGGFSLGKFNLAASPASLLFVFRLFALLCFWLVGINAHLLPVEVSLEIFVFVSFLLSCDSFDVFDLALAYLDVTGLIIIFVWVVLRVCCLFHIFDSFLLLSLENVRRCDSYLRLLSFTFGWLGLCAFLSFFGEEVVKIVLLTIHDLSVKWKLCICFSFNI